MAIKQISISKFALKRLARFLVIDQRNLKEFIIESGQRRTRHGFAVSFKIMYLRRTFIVFISPWRTTWICPTRFKGYER